MPIDLAPLAASDFANVEFFVVCFWADGGGGHRLLPSESFSIVSGEHFWSVSSKHPVSGAGLVRTLDRGYLMLRGYEADLGVHTYSWTSERGELASTDQFRNGCFAHVFIDDRNVGLTAKCDALGIAPIYYRDHDDCLFLSSHATLLSRPTDEPDLLNWLALLQAGTPLGNRSLHSEIKRLPMGSEMIVQGRKRTIETWFDLNQLPDGTEPISKAALDRIETAFQGSVERCLGIASSPSILPFTSGFDSRRIFGSLQQRGADFVTATAQALSSKDGRLYEIDSVLAPKIAEAYGVSWELIEASGEEERAAEFATRAMLVGEETFMHGWAIRFHRWLAQQQPSMVWDGLAGDVFGHGGAYLEFAETDKSRSIEVNKQVVLTNPTVPAVFTSVSNFWPGIQEYRDACQEEFERFPKNLNQAEFAFFASRTRRSTSSWSTMMQAPGHVFVYPHMDLAFVKETLRYHPEAKFRLHLQKECLERFWPELAQFPGSHALPAGFHPIGRDQEAAQSNAHRHLIWKRLENPKTRARALELLSLPMSAWLRLAHRVPALRKRRAWFFDRFLELVGREEAQSPVTFATTRAGAV